jgi:hypothetical protein
MYLVLSILGLQFKVNASMETTMCEAKIYTAD